MLAATLREDLQGVSKNTVDSLTSLTIQFVKMAKRDILLLLKRSV